MPPLTEEQIREIIQDELSNLIVSDRYTFQKLIQIFDGRNIQLGKGTGTKFGTETTQKLSFWGKTPLAQQSPTGITSGFTQNAGNTVRVDSAFDGNLGGNIYTIGDMVNHLIKVGILKS